MVYFLVLVETLVKVGFAAGRGPEDVPLVALCVFEPVGFHKRPDQLGVSSQDLVEEVGVLDMVRSGVRDAWRSVIKELLGCDGVESQVIIVVDRLTALALVWRAEKSICILLSPCWNVQVLQFLEDIVEVHHPLVLVFLLFRVNEDSLVV
jgi:hypothetical protein